MTRRERLERKLEKRRQWAEGRKAKAEATFEAAHAIPMAPFGEPIKIGHHSEKRHRASFEKFDNTMRRAFDHKDMAEHHEQKAAGLADQLDDSIFSDDDNAIEALTARLSEREAERDRIKAYNLTCRKAAKAGEKFGNLDLLDARQRANIESIARVCPYQVRSGGAFPAYALSNLSGRIKADRDRLESIKRRKANAQRAAESPGGVLIIGTEYVNVVFAEKPDRAIITALKDSGFSWGAGRWAGYRNRLPQCVLDLTATA